MSGKEKEEDAVSRLTNLAADLERVYPEAGDRVAQAIKSVDKAIRQIGVSFREPHYAETFSEDTGVRPEGYIAEEEEGNGWCVEYALCAVRVELPRQGLTLETKRICKLQVSACRYRIDDQRGRLRCHMEEISTIRPQDLALPLRVKILDAIDKFAAVYEAYVRKNRANLLNGSIMPKPTE